MSLPFPHHLAYLRVVGQILRHLGAIITVQVISTSLLLNQASISESFTQILAHANSALKRRLEFNWPTKL